MPSSKQMPWPWPRRSVSVGLWLGATSYHRYPPSSIWALPQCSKGHCWLLRGSWHWREAKEVARKCLDERQALKTTGLWSDCAIYLCRNISIICFWCSDCSASICQPETGGREMDCSISLFGGAVGQWIHRFGTRRWPQMADLLKFLAWVPCFLAKSWLFVCTGTPCDD